MHLSMHRAALGLTWLLVGCAPTLPLVGAIAPGRHLGAIEHDGRDRSYRVTIPSSAPQSPAMVVVLHGGGGTASSMEEVTGFGDLAERERFVVVYPEAVDIVHGNGRLWHVGNCCGLGQWLGVDDIGFVRAITQHVAARVGADPGRLFVVGYSNGGALALALASEPSQPFSAVATFGATIEGTGTLDAPLLPSIRRPPALLSVHSRDDNRVPYLGQYLSDEALDVPALQLIRHWAVAGRCRSDATSAVQFGGAVRVFQYSDCPPGFTVEHHQLGEGWRHEWPGPANFASLPAGAGLRDYDAAQAMWCFFQRTSGGR